MWCVCPVIVGCLRNNLDGYVFFFQAEDGIRDLVRSRGLGDVYKRQAVCRGLHRDERGDLGHAGHGDGEPGRLPGKVQWKLSLIHI